MHWKIKCLALYTIGRVPALHRWFQQRVTKRYFMPVTDSELSVYAIHAQNFPGGRALEFGAGANLLSPLLLSRAGATEVFALDLTRHASTDRVNDIIRQLRSKLDGSWPEVVDLDADLFAKYRIRYLAPADARNTGLPAGSIDFVCSTSVLEHIPEREIVKILNECRRIASPKAVLSFIIDYHDHFASADSSISKFNFYRYSDKAWTFFNPSMQYQNRLRHSDFQRLFSAWEGTDRTITAVTFLPPLDDRFKKYSREDLMALNGFFVLRSKDTVPSHG